MTPETEPTDSLSGLRLRSLTPADEAAGMDLSAAAGWNQNAADWRHLLAQGLGWGFEESAGRLRATAILLPYGDRIAWICMVLVAANWRKRGLATRLLRHCIAQGRQRGWQLGLDATAAGRQVYLPLGFADCYPLTRMTAAGGGTPVTAHSGLCRPMQEADLQAIIRLDESVAGFERAQLVRSLYARAPGLCRVAEEAGALRGFCLGRDGLNSDQIGPIVADDPAVAIALAQQALQARRDPSRGVCIDAAGEQGAFRDWLQQSGFEAERGFIRMVKGAEATTGAPARLFAIAGPELS